MSEILARFAELCRDDPKRLLIHLPGIDSALSASDILDAHLRYAERLTRNGGLQAGQLVISAAGNHPSGVGFFLACRAIGVAIMPVDPGTTVAEILGLAERFAAAALLLPAPMAADKSWCGDENSVEIAGLRLVPHAHAAPRGYPGTAILKLTSGSTGLPKTALANDAQLVVAVGSRVCAAWA